MSGHTLTLRDIILPGGAALPAVPWSDVVSREKFSRLKDRLLHAATRVAWADANATLMQRTVELLDIALFEGVLLKVWNEAELFRKYVDPEKYSAKDTVQVVLAKHKIKSEHHPRLELYVDEAHVGGVDFQVTVEVEVKGAVVDVRDGRVWKISAGELECEGEMKCEGVTLAATRLEKIRLKGEKKFEKGIPIVP